ncbi:hypothetical protein BCR42DRAFT_424639 [Absidia repens]|uniref:Ankyrin repeat-containing domain protein n=1 Tax=Absidia repens TaxID=90262 RepID=A0A1X2I3X1_9FUNG|nr:hypothetical protein BCR42DRAFT_424639 [Absidia repens]
MSGLKRKTQDTDDWGLVYSSSSGTDTDSSEDDDDIDPTSRSNKRYKANKQQPFLIQLPHELLCEIFILSSNPSLPVVCRSLKYHLYHCPDSVKLRWLLYRHDNNIQAAFYGGVLFPFFTTRLLHRMDYVYHNEQLTADSLMRVTTETSHSDDNDSDTVSNNNSDAPVTLTATMATTTIPYTKKKMPPHLFNNAASTETADNDNDNDNDKMITLLLERGGSADKPKGYPLIKCAQLGRLDRVQQLVKYGANPTLRNNMALRVCAARNNMEMVLYFLDQLKVTPDSETLRACAQKKLWNMVQVLVDHGAVPDMNTVNFV